MNSLARSIRASRCWFDASATRAGVDDATTLAYVEALDDELGTTCAAFFERAIACFASLGIRIERVISDNGSGYRSFVFDQLCKLDLIRHS